MSTASANQIAAIHATAKNVGINDAERRALMADVAGKTSARDLSFTEAGRVIDRLKALQGGARAVSTVVGKRGALRLDGPYAAKLRALWIAGFNLGVVQDRTDRALCAFVERQAGVSHTRFLREPVEAAKAIEGLKKWISREGGVKWPAAHAAAQHVKLAVIAAQRARLATFGIAHEETWSSTEMIGSLDDVAMALGEALRRALRSN